VRLVTLPLAGEPSAFELLDPVSRDLVKDHRPKRSIQHLQNVAVALNAALVLRRMILDVGVSESLERDVRLVADLVSALENPNTLRGFEFLKLPACSRYPSCCDTDDGSP